jgi:hypothetical protein
MVQSCATVTENSRTIGTKIGGIKSNWHWYLSKSTFYFSTSFHHLISAYFKDYSALFAGLGFSMERILGGWTQSSFCYVIICSTTHSSFTTSISTCCGTVNKLLVRKNVFFAILPWKCFAYPSCNNWPYWALSLVLNRTYNTLCNPVNFSS